MSQMIQVLLPVFNGAPFLQEQLDSIVNQSHQPLHILCRDDGSTDESVAILDAYQARHPELITRLPSGPERLGALQSFALLMQAAEGEGYFALADQDDIWQPDKLAICLSALQKAEQAQLDKPILVHSDLRVIAANGDEIAPSLMAYQGLKPERQGFAAQLVSNTVTGCTTLFNRALLRRALPIPDDAVMHDWWLSLVGSAFGRLVYVETPQVLYRQHASNTLGARRHEPPGLNRQSMRRLFRRHQEASIQQQFEDLAQQARGFNARFSKQLNAHDRRTLKWVCRMPTLGLWGQRILFRLLRNRVERAG
jgi:glycosyltransferase involved in cell wall biosynthesis